MDYKAKAQELAQVTNDLKALNLMNHRDIFSQRISEKYRIIRNKFPQLSELAMITTERMWHQILEKAFAAKPVERKIVNHVDEHNFDILYKELRGCEN